MARDGKNQMVIWPEYFDSNLSRNDGRRVSKEMAIPSPDCDDIYRASRKLDLYPEKDPEKSYPPRWYAGKGMVTIKRKYSKSKTIEKIAEKLK